jgi:hypothetical protein
MNRSAFLRFALRGLLAAMLLLSASHAADLLTDEGRWVSGVATVRDNRLTLQRADGAPLTVACDRLLALRLSSAAPREWPGPGVRLANGDRLSGDVLALTNGAVTLSHEWLGSLSIPRDEVVSIRFVPPRGGSAAEPALSPPGIVLANGDRLEGTLSRVTATEVVLDAGGTPRALPRERCAWIALGPGAEPAAVPGEAHQRIRLANGDILSGRLVALDAAQLTLAVGGVGTLAIPVARAPEIRGEGGALVPLSTLTPTRVVETPQFDERFPWRRDRAVGGGPLTLGGRPYERGLGCHSRCELLYSLEAGVTRFVAEIGLDARAPSGAVAEFVVECDGREAFRSGPVAAGAPPRAIAVDLRGRRQLKLLVDFGPDGSSMGDHGNWAGAMVVK